MARPSSCYPSPKTKTWKLLNALMQGERVTPGYAVLRLNLPTFQARCAELRAMGWPVRTMKEGHPVILREHWDVYFFDAHFRNWLLDNPDAHPQDYRDTDGRGKFV